MAMNRTPPIISMAWSPSNVKLTMWRQLLFELTHFCCVVKTMNNSLYTLYVGVGSRAAGRSTILRLRSKARQSLDWTHTSSGGWCWECLCEDESPPPPYHKAKNEMCVCVCLSDWKSEDVYMWRVSAYMFTLGDLCTWLTLVPSVWYNTLVKDLQQPRLHWRWHQIVSSYKSRWESHT